MAELSYKPVTNREVLYAKLFSHIGHEVEVVGYGWTGAERPVPDAPLNVAFECLTCGCVILDANRDRERDDED